MIEDLVLIKDEALTAEAKKVFGEDLIVSAYIAEANLLGDASTERDLIRRENWNKGDMYDDLDGIAYDGTCIVIQFVNDRYILFANSKEGSMENIDISKLHFSRFSSIPNG